LPASEPGTAPNHGTNDHGILSAISNEMVRIYKDQFGRGPRPRVAADQLAETLLLDGPLTC
jgi:hypothetical protein